MPSDFEAKVPERFLRKTLWLWLFPYIFWFFGRRIVQSLYEWLTEPHPNENERAAPRV